MKIGYNNDKNSSQDIRRSQKIRKKQRNKIEQIGSKEIENILKNQMLKESKLLFIKGKWKRNLRQNKEF